MKRTLGISLTGLMLLMAAANAYAIPIDVFQGGFFKGTIDAFSGPESNFDNYDYRSASAHTINGPTPTAGDMQFFFYDGSDGLGFFMVFGEDTTGGTGLRVSADIAVSGSSTDPGVILSDDGGAPPGGEFIETATNDLFEGRWAFGNNSDGGVLGTLGGSGWEIVFDPLRVVGMETMTAYGLGGEIALDFVVNSDPAFDDRLVFRPHRDAPEPASLWLTGLGLCTLSGIRRRRG